jgi:PAT family beta-lactamase induction signal transducer AmpG
VVKPFPNQVERKLDDAVSPRDSEVKTLAWTSSIYFAEGLPWSLLHQVAAEYFTAIGVSPSGVGRTSLLHGPMLFKVVLSPLLELWGTLRSWMVATQATMGILVGLLALAAESLAGRYLSGGNFVEGAAPSSSLVWSLLFAVGICSAFHDIACDGFYMESLNEERQARFSGVRVAAYRSAMLVGSAGLVVLGGRISWLVAFSVGGLVLFLLAIVHQIFLPRGRGGGTSSLAPAEAKKKRERGRFLDPYVSFLTQDSVLLVVAFLVLYKLADTLMFSMSSVFLGRELGIGTDLRGVIRTFSVLASILGAMVGGAWIARKGLDKTLLIITVLMVGTVPLYALLANFSEQLSIFSGTEPATLSTVVWAQDGVTLSIVTIVIVIEQIFGGFATAAQVVFIMRRCHIEYRTAHYAFSTAIISLTHMGLGVGSGVVYEAVGATSYFWLVSALALPAVVLALMVPTGSQAATRA